MEIVTSDYCSCQKDEAFFDGSMPQYVDNEEEAIKLYNQVKRTPNNLYWAIHLNGKHVLKIKP